MERVFVDEANGAFVELGEVIGASFEARRGRLGRAGRKRRHEHAGSRAAVEGYLAEVEALYEGGYVELLPWLRYERGGDELLVRPPVLARLEQVITRAGQRPRRSARRYASVEDATQAYNRAMRRHARAGFKSAIAPWHEGFEAPGEGFEYKEALEDGKLRRRYFQRVEAPQDEFGPEWWYKEGEASQHNLQYLTQKQGAAVRFKQGYVYEVALYHRDKLRGVIVVLDDQGLITRYIRVTREVDEGGAPFERRQERDRENLIIEIRNDSRVLRTVDFWRFDGTLEQHKDFDEAGKCVRITFHDAAGRMKQLRTRQEGGWWREDFDPDGTLNARAALDEDGRYHGPRELLNALGEVLDVIQYDHGDRV